MLGKLKRLVSRPTRAASESTAAERADALKEQGNRHFIEGELQEAEQCYRNALTLLPGRAELHNNLGVVLDRTGRFGEAIASFLQALTLNPDYEVACLNIGNWHRTHGNPNEQIRYLEKAISLKPDYVEALNNLGSALHKAGRAGEAVPHLEQATRLRPEFGQARLNLALCYRDTGRRDDEIAALERAIALQPDFHDAWDQLGYTWQALGDFAKAEQYHRRATALAPDHPRYRLNLGHALLQQGNYEEGLVFFEARFAAYKLQDDEFDDTYFSTVANAPCWNGEDLHGKTLLLWMEQGLGDNLMMLRHLPQLRRMGVKRLVVWSRPELARMIRHLPNAPEVILTESESQAHVYDYHCALTSLPYLLGIRLDTIPADVPYLCVPDEIKQAWANRLAQYRGMKIGLVWAGNPKMPRDSLRSIALEQLRPLRQVAGAVFVSLQKGQAEHFPASEDWLLHECIDDCTDFLDTAALVENLDLVIGVDTSTIHLAGALGKPVWLLNRFESEWRWMTGRSDSPWYPTLRIFRQPARGNWGRVIDEVKQALLLALNAAENSAARATRI